jgi:hypothetical protein
MRALKPAVVVVFGAPILRAGVLSLGSHATVNVHLGIPPKYRGNNTIFWALKQRDFDHVGAACTMSLPARILEISSSKHFRRYRAGPTTLTPPPGRFASFLRRQWIS